MTTSAVIIKSTAMKEEKPQARDVAESRNPQQSYVRRQDAERKPRDTPDDHCVMEQTLKDPCSQLWTHASPKPEGHFVWQ